MTAGRQPMSKSPSRRALLAGALGGIGAMAAAAIGRVSPVRADGTAMVTGGEYTDALTPTGINNNTNNATVLYGSSGGSGIGVHGHSDAGKGVDGTSDTGVGVSANSSSYYAVWGTSTSYVGVRGSSTSLIGVAGDSNAYIGVYGSNLATNQPAIAGVAGGHNTGVQGVSGAVDATAPAKTGVHGFAAQDSTSRGVIGESPAGSGVHGFSGPRPGPATQPRTGVYGYANQDSTAKGIFGESAKGFAGYFAGKVYTSRFLEMTEQSSNPPAPGTNKARLFLRDDGAGHTQLCVRFNTGSVKVLATQT